MFGSGAGGQRKDESGRISFGQGGAGGGSGAGASTGANTGAVFGSGFGKKSPAPSTAGSSLFGSQSGFGGGSGDSGGSSGFGGAPRLTSTEPSGPFASRHGVGRGSNADSLTNQSGSSANNSFFGRRDIPSSGSAPSGSASKGLGTGGVFGTFGGGGDSSTTGIGLGPSSAAGKSSDSGVTQSWASVATAAPSVTGFGSGRGFGSRGGFGSVSNATTIGNTAGPGGVTRGAAGVNFGSNGGDGSAVSSATKSGFGTGGGFGGGNGAVGFGGNGAVPKISTNVFGGAQKNQLGDGAWRSASGLHKADASSGSGSFADAAKRGAALSSSAWGVSAGSDRIPSAASMSKASMTVGAGNFLASSSATSISTSSSPFLGNEGRFGARTTSANIAAVGSSSKKQSSWFLSSKTRTSTAAAGAGASGSSAERSHARAGGSSETQKSSTAGVAAPGTGQSAPKAVGSWGGGFLTASGRARKRASAGVGDDDGAAPLAPNKSNNGTQRGSNRVPGGTTPAIDSSVAGDGRSRVMGGFGGTPNGATFAPPPAFIGGGGRGKATPATGGGSSAGITQYSRTPSSTGSKIMGGFGAPPPADLSQPPTFLGGRRGAQGSKSGGSDKKDISQVSFPAGGTKILGGFGAPPSGGSSDPPAFIGGGTDDRDTSRRSRAPMLAGTSRITGSFGAPPLTEKSVPSSFLGRGEKDTGKGSTYSTTIASVGAQDVTDDMAAKARRAQRFADVSGAVLEGGGRGGGSGKSRSGGGTGGDASGGSGSAEDVQRGNHLDEAEIKVGTVQGMCPAEEFSRRVPGDLHILEKEHPSLYMPDDGMDGGSPQLWTHRDLVVKRHQRAAAGMDISKPELLRTPEWLARTVDHLVMSCMDEGPHGGGDPSLAWDDPRVEEYVAKFRANNPSRADAAEEETEHDLYNFVWDRFRMVRSDYNMQGFNPVVGLVSEASIVAHERMARWYVLMANRMEKNSMQTHRFNLKSIVETLKKLYEFYTIRVSRGEVVGGLASPNEPEIMAYYLLTVLEQDGGVEVQRLVKNLVRSRRKEVLESSEIKGALQVVRAWHAGDYVTFFRALRQQGVMHRCLLSQYVKSMRNRAINVISASFADFSLSEIMRLLCFKSEEQTVEFLRAYSLKVSSAGQVLLREKDRNGTWRIPFRRPDTFPDPPPLQDIVEPKPWRLASEWVYKGDYEPAADKSHDVNISGPSETVAGDPRVIPGSARSRPGAGIAALRRATSSSSTTSSVGGGIRAKVEGRASPRNTAASFSQASELTTLSPATVSVGAASSVGTKAALVGSGVDFSSKARVGAPGVDARGKFSFAAAAGPVKKPAASASTIATSSNQQSTLPAQQKMPSATASVSASARDAPPPYRGGFAFGSQSPPVSVTQGAPTSAIASPELSTSGAPTFATSSGNSGTTFDGANGGSGTQTSAASTAVPISVQANRRSGGEGMSGRQPDSTSSILSGFTFVHPPAPARAQPVDSSPSLAIVPPPGSRKGTGTVAPLPKDGAGPFPSGRGGVSSLPTAGDAATVSARAPSAAGTPVAVGQQVGDAYRRQREQEAERKRQLEREASMRAAAAAAAKAREDQLILEAETRAKRALLSGKLIPVDVVNQLPENGRIRRMALEHRKALGLRLARLGPGVARRKRAAAWGRWVQETLRLMEEQHTVELRERRYEGDRILVENAQVFRRTSKKRRSSQSRAGYGKSTRGPDGTRGADNARKMPSRAGEAATARRNGTAETKEPLLCKPQPLDLPVILARGLAKNQGADAEEAFRAVGLTATVEQPLVANGMEKHEESASFSPPHLFWKAVVVAPSRSRGNVQQWLEAKFGGRAGGVGDVSAYEQALTSEGICPWLREKGEEQGDEARPSVRQEDMKEVACGSSASSKLIYRTIKTLPTSLSAQKGGTISRRPQFMHLCVQRVSLKEGCRLQSSPQLSEALNMTSVIMFAATPKDQERFFWSPLNPKPDWSQAREDLERTLDAASPRHVGGTDSGSQLCGVPLLIAIPVKDSAIQKPKKSGSDETDVKDDAAAVAIREKILEDAWEGLGLRRLAERGSSFRVALVGMHEFASRSKAAAAKAEGLVFAGDLEETCTNDVATKLAELAEQAPRQPLIATRSLQEMLRTAVSRATTDNRYAVAAGLPSPISPMEDPPLDYVVKAATRATEDVCRLLARRVDTAASTWPMPEFAVTMARSRNQPTYIRSHHDQAQQERGKVVTFVPGAARPAGGEITGSPLLHPETSAGAGGDDGGNKEAVRDKFLGLIEASGGLPIDWAPPQNAAIKPDAAAILRAAALPPIPVEIAQAFSPEALAGADGSRPLGAKVAWSRVEQLEAYLGESLVAEGLRYRLAEALAGGAMMRGSPPPWRTLVRDAVMRKVASAGRGNGGLFDRGGGGRGGGESRPLVVHFVAASGQERLESGKDDLIVPRLLEAEQYLGASPSDRDVSTSAEEDRALVSLRQSSGNRGEMVARASAALKRVASLMPDARSGSNRGNNKHRRTNSRITAQARAATHHRRLFFDTGRSGGAADDDLSDDEMDNDDDDDDDRLLQERIGRIALETENVRASRDRAASFAAADRDLDTAFLASFGVSLTPSGTYGSAADGGRPLSASMATEATAAAAAVASRSFDRSRVTSLPLRPAGSVNASIQARERQRQEKELRRRRAKATLSPSDYECWAIRENLDDYRRQEAKMREEIFNGDPLLPLAGASLPGGREA